MKGELSVGITYREVEERLRDALYNVNPNYVEITNGNLTVIVDRYSNEKWKVQFYHKETNLIVQSELVMDKDIVSIKSIHEALELLKSGTVGQVQMLQGFTFNILAIRQLEEDKYDCEFIVVTNILEYLQVRELFSYDESIKDVFDGNGHYPTIKQKLLQYGIAK